MRRSLPYVCFFLFVVLAVGVSASDYILWGRFKRKINSRNQNLSQHNFDPTWYNPKQPASNRTGSQWNNPRDSYNHGYSLNPNDLTLIDNNRPQNTYGPNTYPNTYNVQPPAWNGPNLQRNNPSDQFYPGNTPRDRQWINPNDQFYQGNNPRDRQWNNPNDQYYQRNNPQDIGWKPQSTSGYNTNVNGYNSRSSVFNGTRSQLINPAPQRNNPSGSNYQGNLNYPYNPTQINAKPQNTSWYNTNPNSQNTKASYGQEWNNLGNQYNPVPNDLNRNRYKRSVNNRYYNATFFPINPYLRSSNPYGNRTQYNRSRRTREIRRDDSTCQWSREREYYYTPDWLKKAQNLSHLESNKPGGHWPVNNQNNETYHNVVPKNEDLPRHQHRHRHHHHHISGPPPPQFGSPSPLRPPPPVGPPPPIRPPPPIDSTGSNGNVINGTNPWVPETGSGLNGTNVNSTYPWGSELPDMDNRDEFVSTPVPQ